MSITRKLIFTLLLTALAAPLQAGDAPVPPASSAALAVPPAPTAPWTAQVATSDRGGHVLGNPAAAVQLVEYASYTCGHCAHFEAEDAPRLKADEIASGRVSFEIRNLARDGIDLTVAALARCGAKEGFFDRHKYWMATQAQWMEGAALITPSTGDKGQTGDIPGLLAGIYTDMRLSAHAAKTGVSDDAARACLADEGNLGAIITMTREAKQSYAIPGTPSFLVNGTYVDAAHDYASIRQAMAGAGAAE